MRERSFSLVFSLAVRAEARKDATAWSDGQMMRADRPSVYMLLAVCARPDCRKCSSDSSASVTGRQQECGRLQLMKPGTPTALLGDGYWPSVSWRANWWSGWRAAMPQAEMGGAMAYDMSADG